MDTTDMATGAASSMLSKLGELLIFETGRQIGYFINYNNNIGNLKKQTENLKHKQDGVKLSVENAKRNGDVILPEVVGWLGRVDKLWTEATIFLEHHVKENKGCLYGWCPNLKTRYSQSRRANKMTQEVIELQNQQDRFKTISERPRLMGIELTSNGNFLSFLSRERISQELKDILKRGDFHMIGICGLGGVGKTKLIKEIGKWAHEEKLFDEIVMATVSKNPTLKDIQGELAVKLGLTLIEPALGARAAQLWDRLLQDSKRNFLILDDVWESIDLSNIGIPVGNGNNKNIIVMTSRFEGVCEAMRCDKIIKIDVLSEEEAWILFREMAGGTLVDAPDYIEVASKVAKECRGLPIAIVTVGSALKGKKIEVWNDAHLKLSQSIANLPGVEKEVFQSLKLSYDQVYIEDKEAWSILLLCCLYPEDANISVEELVWCGMGKKLFKGIKLVMDARDRVHALIDKLQTCFLLLDGDEPYTVKMHDVVRDVGIWIGSKNDYFKMVVINGEWEQDDEYEHCNALSVISSEITELPSEGLNCPGLDVLHMSCDMLSTEKLNVGNIFEGVKKLRVLGMFKMFISSLPSSLQLLTNLRVLNLEYCWLLENVCIPEELVNLEILSLRGCKSIKNVPTEMGRFTKLRVLDMRGCRVESVSPGVISSMCRLEELYTESWPWDEECNASLNELESLCNLTIIMTGTQQAKFLPKDDSVLEKLKSYHITIGAVWHAFNDFAYFPFVKKALFLTLNDITETPIRFGVVGKLLKESAEHVFLQGDRLVIALDELAAGGFRQVKGLVIISCSNEVVEYVANYSSTAREEVNWSFSSFGVFTKLEKLQLVNMSHLKAILSCCGESGVGSFENLQHIHLWNLPKLTQLWKYDLTIHPEPAAGAIKLSNLNHVELWGCKSLEYLFTVSEATFLENLKTLVIQYCSKMEAVILESLGASYVNNVVIKFPKLEFLSLYALYSLTCFSCTAMEFPQLKRLEFYYLEKFDSLASMFSNKQVLFPSLESLHISEMRGKELWGSPYPASFFPKLEYLSVDSFSKILNIIPVNSAQCLSGLMNLEVKNCDLLEEVFESRGVNFGVGGGSILFNNLTQIRVDGCVSLKSLCSSSVARNLRNLLVLTILDCESIEEVIANEEEEDGSNKDETIFPQLKELTLEELPSLKRFFHVNSNFKLPDGLKIDCPDLLDLRSKAN